MNKKYVKPIVLTVVFLISVLVFSELTNKVNKDLTTTMAEASLPIMHFVCDDQVVNELHGYVQEMDMLSMRDGLMPVGKERGLHLEIMTYGNHVDKLSYEIRSIDGKRLLVEEDDADITVTQDKVDCDISLPSLFEDNQEYNMKFTLTMGEREVYYYTRIVRTLDYYTDECLDFALTFHDYTFRDDAKDFIPTYMDPATGDATTLNYVDLTCTLRQITWANFNGVKLTEPVVSFNKPKGVVGVYVDPSSGLLADKACPVKRLTYYKKGTEPTRYCPVHRETERPSIHKEKTDPKSIPWYKKVLPF